MNSVGIDVSKNWSMVTILRLYGEVVSEPFIVNHTPSELSELAASLRKLKGETKVIMECTGSYYKPIANALSEEGLFVSTVHALVIHNYGNNSIRTGKTDKASSLKIANYGLSYWLELQKYVPEEDIRNMLKMVCRQYSKYMKIRTSLKNNFIHLLDQTFPGGLNELFTSGVRASDGHEKWIDFALKFWHHECISRLSLKDFSERYQKWCKKNNYNYSYNKAKEIHSFARNCYSVIKKDESTRILIESAAKQLISTSESVNTYAREMTRLAKLLPEYPVVESLYGVGDILGPQLIAEIGDVRRFEKKGSLVCYAGLDVPPNQSGKFNAISGRVSKKGSPFLRATLFKVINSYIVNSPADEPVYQFINRKRSEGKHYYNYMVSASGKFLRIYYARVSEFLRNLDNLAI